MLLPTSSSTSCCLTYAACEGNTLVNLDDRLMRVVDVAQALGIDGTDVYVLIRNGELDAGKKGGRVYVPESALREYLERQAQASR